MRDGSRREGYYAFRLAIRAFKGGRPTYQSTTNNSNLMAITTKDATGTCLLVTKGGSKALTVDANLSALLTSGAGTMWQYSAGNMDVVVGNPSLVTPLPKKL